MIDLIETFDGPVSTCTRAEALEDGTLVDVSKTASEAGFRIPVALTTGAYVDCVEWSDTDNQRKGTLQDQDGRLWDVVWMASQAIRVGLLATDHIRDSNADTITFVVHRVPRGGRGRKPKPVRLHMRVGGGDEGEPVVTIDLARE